MTIFICSIDDDEATVEFEYRSKSPTLSYLNITLIILTFRFRPGQARNTNSPASESTSMMECQSANPLGLFETVLKIA